MAFFKSFQQSLPSVTSILDTVSSKVDDLASAVSDATYTVSDQLSEQVNNIISKVQAEEEERARKAEEAELAAQEEERYQPGRGKLKRQDNQASHDPHGGADEDYSSGYSQSYSSSNAYSESGRRNKNRSRYEEEQQEEEEDEEERERRARKEERRRERERRKEEERLREEERMREEERKREEEEERRQEEERRRKEEARRRAQEEAQRKEEEEEVEAEAEGQPEEEDEEEDEWSLRNKSRKNQDQSRKKKQQEEKEDDEEKQQEEEEEVDQDKWSHSNSKNKSRQSRNQDEENLEDRRGSSSSQDKTSKRGQLEELKDNYYKSTEGTKAADMKNNSNALRAGSQRSQKKVHRGYEEEDEEEEEEEAEENEEESEEMEDYRKPGKGAKNSTTDRRQSSVIGREDAGRRGSSREMEKENSQKNSGRGDRGTEQGSSESEEERPWRRGEPASQTQKTSCWGSSGNKPSEKEAYNSKAPAVQANSSQRMRHSSQLNELQPPPYRASSHQQSRQTRAQDSEEEESEEEDDEEDDEEEDSEEEEGSDDPDYQKEDVPSDSTAVLGPEDTSVPPLPAGYEPEELGKYGTLDVAFEYDSGEQRLAVTVTAATDIPALKSTGNVSWQVHLVLLPTKKQRAKTGVQKGPCPVFTETFRFSRVEQEALGNYAVRFRLYSVRRMKKEKVLGEKVFYLTKLNLKGKTALPVTLEPGSSVTGCGSMVSVSRSMGALSYHSTGESASPELLLGLLYNSTTGRLAAEVIKGTHFKNNASDKLPSLFCCIKQFIGGQLYIMRDTYVKLIMLDSKGKQMSKCKTSVCRGQPNPTYKETFIFQVALFQLSEVTLQVSVYSRRSSMKRRERLGWVALGLNSTSEEQEDHWTHMREAEGQQVCQWHTLLDT